MNPLACMMTMMRYEQQQQSTKISHIHWYIYTCYNSKLNTHQRKEKRKEFSQNILQQKLHKSVLQTKLNSMCKAKFILIKVRVIALYSDLSYNIQNLISHIIYKINVKKKEISLTLSSKQWYSQSFSYHSLIKSSSQLQIIKKKNTTHTILHSRQQQNKRGERKEGRKGGR